MTGKSKKKGKREIVIQRYKERENDSLRVSCVKFGV